MILKDAVSARIAANVELLEPDRDYFKGSVNNTRGEFYARRNEGGAVFRRERPVKFSPETLALSVGVEVDDVGGVTAVTFRRCTFHRYNQFDTGSKEEVFSEDIEDLGLTRLMRGALIIGGVMRALDIENIASQQTMIQE